LSNESKQALIPQSWNTTTGLVMHEWPALTSLGATLHPEPKIAEPFFRVNHVAINQYCKKLNQTDEMPGADSGCLLHCLVVAIEHMRRAIDIYKLIKELLFFIF